MKNKNILIIGVVVVGLILFFLARSFFLQPEQSQVTYERKRGGPCPGATETHTMQDPYMRGIIEIGQKFNVITNYYDCNPPQNGDYVFYQMHKSMQPVVKIIRGKEGDQFRLLQDKKYKAWNLEVNGKIVYSQTEKNLKYFFGGPATPPLGRYYAAHKGKIGKGDVILLSSWPPGDIDSGTFGMFSLLDVVGKVELVK